ncbi:hypothetical protein N0V88_002590 [Collariella sp. IMI 366227]|nr:hypothetical protein N0V88_002590 [Collariella sp. IMI 366227]
MLLSYAPQIAILESLVCKRVRDGLRNQVVEQFCKSPAVQGDLVLLTELKDTFDQIPGIVLALPYGYVANRIGPLTRKETEDVEFQGPGDVVLSMPTMGVTKRRTCDVSDEPVIVSIQSEFSTRLRELGHSPPVTRHSNKIHEFFGIPPSTNPTPDGSQNTLNNNNNNNNNTTTNMDEPPSPPSRSSSSTLKSSVTNLSSRLKTQYKQHRPAMHHQTRRTMRSLSWFIQAFTPICHTNTIIGSPPPNPSPSSPSPYVSSPLVDIDHAFLVPASTALYLIALALFIPATILFILRMTIFPRQTYRAILRERDTSGLELGYLASWPAAFTLLVGFGGFAVAEGGMAAPVVVVSFFASGAALFLADFDYSVILHELMLVIGWPPIEHTAVAFTLVGPMGQCAAALVVLANAAGTGDMVIATEEMTFEASIILRRMLTMLPLELFCVLMALMIGGIAVMWLLVGIMTVIYRLLRGELVWNPSWNGMISPISTLGILSILLGMELNSAFFRIAACVITIACVLLVVVNLLFNVRLAFTARTRRDITATGGIGEV